MLSNCLAIVLTIYPVKSNGNNETAPINRAFLKGILFLITVSSFSKTLINNGTIKKTLKAI